MAMQVGFGVNNLPAQPQARQPRGVVKLGDEIIKGWVSFEVDNNSFYQADTFRVVFALSLLPAERNADWFSQQTEIMCEVLAGFPLDAERYTPAELDSLIYGRVDDVNFDPVAGTVEVSGRDLTSVFIDAKTTEKWQNLKAHQIVQELAKRHGLTAVATETKTVVGTYYQLDHANMSDQRSEWDMLTWLAHKEQFVIFVKGKELHFEPLPKETDEPYLLRWDAPNDERGHPVFNGKAVSFTRSLTLAKGVSVTVKSWNQKQKKGFTVTYPNKAKGAQPGKAGIANDGQVYSYVVPNKTQEEALQIAQAKHREITKHEVKLSATMPADNLLAVTHIIRVDGTKTAFDQIYYPDNIVRRMDIHEGYSMSINAKNHSPDSVVQP